MNTDAEFKYRYLLSLIKGAASSYTQTGKLNIYDVERQAIAIDRGEYKPEEKVMAYSDWVRDHADD
jgi:hypothetical protein